MNLIRYQAKYFCHILHVDQNEKLVKYGVTHVMARDGFSGKVITYMTLPIKNHVAIYDQVYRYVLCTQPILWVPLVQLPSSLSISVCRTAVSKYGLWDQVRIDHGREFYLILYIQEQLRRLYGAWDVLPYVQSRSTEVQTHTHAA